MHKRPWLVLLLIAAWTSMGAQEAPGPLDVVCEPPVSDYRDGWTVDSLRRHMRYRMSERDHHLLMENPEGASPAVIRARLAAAYRRSCVVISATLAPRDIVNIINPTLRDAYRAYSVLFDRETERERRQLAATLGAALDCQVAVQVMIIGTFEGYESGGWNPWRPLITQPTVVFMDRVSPTLKLGWESFYPTLPEWVGRRVRRSSAFQYTAAECDRLWPPAP